MSTITTRRPSARRRLRYLGALTAGALALTLAACGSDDDSAAEPAGTGAEETAAASTFPVTITHRLGEVTIEEQPERVIALGINDMDTTVGLGITPVGIARVGYSEDGIPPWLAGQIDPAKTELLQVSGGPNIEQIASLRPDVILANPLPSIDDYYEGLSGVAPTVVDSKGVLTDTWQERTLATGKALGREADAQSLVDETEGAIAEARQAHPGLEGKTYTLAWANAPGSVAVMASDDITAKFFKDLGLSLTQQISELPTRSGSAAGAGGAMVSYEQLDLLDADLLVVAYNSPDLKNTVESNSLFKSIPAVAEGRYLAVDLATIAALRVPSLKNIPWLLDQLDPVFTKAEGR